MSDTDDTLVLLQRWHGGDRAAIDELLQGELDFVRAAVRKRLGDALRRDGDSLDYVQEVALEVLEYVPRFLCANRRQFRALLARIVGNTLADRSRRAGTARRDPGQRLQSGLSDTVLAMDPAVESVVRPESAAAQAEEQAWLTLALDIVDPETRQLIHEQRQTEVPLAERGARHGLSADAIRMKYRRAAARVARTVERLRRGELEQVLQDLERADGEPRTP